MLSSICFCQERDSTLSGGQLTGAVVSGVRELHTDMSLKLPRSKVANVPATFGESDVLKMIQLLPGIGSAAEGDVGVSVRGGSLDQTMLLMDGVPIYNPSHLNGFISAFNTSMISGVEVFKGGFPAQFGSRLSGIVNVTMRDGSFDRYHGSVNVGLLSSCLMVEGPLWRDHTSFIVSARRSYSRYVLIPLIRAIFGSGESMKNALQHFGDMDFYDVNARVTHRFTSRDFISLSGYVGRDKVDARYEGRDTLLPNRYDESFSLLHSRRIDEQSQGQEWGNLIGSLRYSHNFEDGVLTVRGDVSHFGSSLVTKYRSARMEELKKDKYYTFSDLIGDSDNKSDITDYGVSASYSVRRGNLLNLNTGVSANFQKINPGIKSYARLETIDTTGFSEGKEPVISVATLVRDTTLGQWMTSFAAYLENEFKIGKSVFLTAGVRASIYRSEGKTYFIPEPRLRVRGDLSYGISLMASYSRMSQALQLLSSSHISRPADVWVGIKDWVGPAVSDQVTLGVQYDMLKIGYPIKAMVEGYYKKTDGIVNLLEGVSINDIAKWTDIVDSGKQNSYGVEVFVEKTSGDNTGFVSYTCSRTTEVFDKINQGRPFLSNYDCRHNLSMSYTHVFNRNFDLSINFVYRTGRRITLSNYIIYKGAFMEDYSWEEYRSWNNFLTMINDKIKNPSAFENLKLQDTYYDRNMYTMPDYHRLDIGFNWHLYHKFGKSKINFSLYNAYNRLNPYHIYQSRETGVEKFIGTCLFPILPAISYSYEF
ncbi:MAG: TonB-dependent receptor plug domain-containing protein [Bacteroidales bacterium]|nr:TonB-dependent receptor plug domain-containing protein [Bacteroidales bacterium]